MQTINEISTHSSLELPLSKDGVIDISQCVKHSIDVFWNRRLAHAKATLESQKRQNAQMAAHDMPKKNNRYLDNLEYFRSKASRIEEGYNSWIGKTLDTKSSLATDMNLYLNNRCPEFKAIDDIPAGLFKFMMMIIPKNDFFRTTFNKFAPEVMEGCRGRDIAERKYEFSSDVFYNVVLIMLVNLWNEDVQKWMEKFLVEQPNSELIIAALEETVLNYDDTRLQAERICTLKKIADAKKLPAFEEIKKQVTLFKAFLSLEQVSELNQLGNEEYDKQLQLFAEKWNRLAAQKPGDNQTPQDFDEMMVEVQKSMISQQLRTAIYLKNSESGEGVRDIKNNAKSGDEEAKNALKSKSVSFTSIDELDASGRPLSDTIADPDSNGELNTPEDFSQEIWNGLNKNEKAYLILSWARTNLNTYMEFEDDPVCTFFAEKIGCRELRKVNGKDGFQRAFTDVTGCKDIPHVIVSNILRQCVEKLTDEKLHSINSHNYDAIERQMLSLVASRGIRFDLNENWDTLHLQCIVMHLADEKDSMKKTIVDEIDEIVRKVIEVQQRRM